MDAILKRRSIRKYENKPIEEQTITKILQAAMSAPSAGNQQPWHFVVIRDRAILDAIPQYHPYAQMMTQAPVAIVVCGDPSLEKHKGYWVQDCSAAVQNILIAVESLGLGAVWLGVYPNEERMEPTRKLLGIPQSVIPMAIIPMGYPAEFKPPADRYNEQRIHMEKW